MENIHSLFLYANEDYVNKARGRIVKEYINIGKIDKEKIGKYKNRIITEDVILTYERLNNHILAYHKDEYYEIEKYVRDIIENPDIIIDDNAHIDTLIHLKHIKQINKKARIVIKLATNFEEENYTKNSVITIMRQRDKSWEQTIKNKGEIIYHKI